MRDADDPPRERLRTRRAADEQIAARLKHLPLRLRDVEDGLRFRRTGDRSRDPQVLRGMAQEQKAQRRCSNGYAEPTKKHQRERADQQNFSLRILLPGSERLRAKQRQRGGLRVSVRLLHAGVANSRSILTPACSRSESYL